jgi:hypothetical protein
MAFGTKYRCEFSDELLVDWKWDIQVDPDPGSIITLQASGEPLSIEWYGEDDILEQNIMGSKASLSVETLTDFALSDIFTSDNLSKKVLIYQNGNLFWSGWILANEYQEPYDGVPFSVTISAVDGLGLLKDFNFEDLAYTDRKLQSTMIYDILSNVGITTFTDYVNIYESTMNSTVDDSLFDQGGFENNLFMEMNCYEALSEMLKSLNAGIRQSKGVFEIFRYKELSDATMYGRIFTSDVTKSSTTKTPAQKINRPSDASSFSDLNGGTLMIYPACKTAYINQDYKQNASIIENSDFPKSEFTYEPSVWSLNEWYGTATIEPTCVTKPQAGDKGLFILDAETGSHVKYLAYDIPSSATTDRFMMEFEFSGWGDDATGSIYFSLLSDDGVTFKAFNILTKTWDTVLEDAFIYNRLDTRNYGYDMEFVKKAYETAGIPYDNCTLYLWAGYSGSGDVYALWKNVNFYFVDGEGGKIEGVGYTIENSDYGQILEREYIIGDGSGFDNDYLQYDGAYSKGTTVTTSRSWYTRGNTENKPLINLIGEEYVAQRARTKQIIDLPLMETSASTFLDLNGNLQDSLNQYSGSNRKFAISRANYDVRTRSYNLTLTEIL